MKSYNSYFFKITEGPGAGIVYKMTCMNPNSENKGSLFIFNNVNHVQFIDRETIKTVFLNILNNGSCNGIPQEIGGIEDRTITSIVIDMRQITNIEDLINSANIVLSELLLENPDYNPRYVDYAKAVIRILKDYNDPNTIQEMKYFNIVYFDIYDPVNCMGYWTIERNGSPVFDFVRMQGSSTTEDLKVGGSTVSGINIGYIRPAPFSLGPIEFNPIGNDVIDLDSTGMTANYIGLLRDDPSNFKEFRVYLTVKFNAHAPDGKFIGRSQELYDTFVRCIVDGNKQAKEGGELDLYSHKLPLELDSIKVEIQGENPENIKAIDIATIFNKAMLVINTKDPISVCHTGDEMIDPNNVITESDTVCTVRFTTDNEMYLEPIFVDASIK